MSPTAEPFEQVLDLSAQDSTEGEYLLGDTNNDGKVDLMDANAIIDNYLFGSEFLDSKTDEIYKNGELAANVNGDKTVNLMDANAVIDKYLYGIEFETE